ncbi:MAG: hypothetical protein J4F98_11070 [Acidobacteria bacterium]|nr:hypothetical protein [Acidobacteriota bacterium]
MIGYLRGRRQALGPELLVLDVGGVGYSVRIPLSTWFELDRLEADAEFGLHIHTHVRADAIELFGFWSEAERTLFEHCLSVTGIGPRLAQVVLSGGSTADLLTAVADPNPGYRPQDRRANGPGAEREGEDAAGGVRRRTPTGRAGAGARERA